MAGGLGILTANQDFALNPKCLAVSSALVGAYFILPCRCDANKARVWGTAALIASASYVGLAWYDHFYDCEDKMKSGALRPLYAPFKPPVNPRTNRYT